MKAAGTLAMALAAGSLMACAGGAGDALERNPREGQFYTNDEIVQLSRPARDRYCEEMEDYLEDLRAETLEFNARLDTLAASEDTLRTQTIELSSQIREINNELRELRLRRKSIESYTTKEGDTLRSVAKLVLGDPLRWQEIYDANAGKVANPEAALPAGTVLTIPRGGR